MGVEGGPPRRDGGRPDVLEGLLGGTKCWSEGNVRQRETPTERDRERDIHTHAERARERDSHRETRRHGDAECRG